MVVAHQRDRLEDLRLVAMLRENVPRGRGNSAAIDEVVDRGQEGLLGRAPAGGIGRAVDRRLGWELRDRPRRFRELQDAIGASPTIVNTRLADLRDARLVALSN